MSSLDEIKNARLKKREAIQNEGNNPYPSDLRNYEPLTSIVEQFSSYESEKTSLVAAGRVMALRSHGKTTFADLYDGTAQLQLFFTEKELSKDAYAHVTKFVDIGDFVEVKGIAYRTKKNEKSIRVSRWRMLTKSIRPLPEKWHGLQDTEERFRKRYLDMLMNHEVRDRFLTRSKLLAAIRKYLNRQEFFEVETPLLHPVPGGALANPFVTHHDALGRDFFLRIAPELYLKRLLVGGMPKIYEIGRSFRNEGIDATHNPEFSMLELYEAYSSAEKHHMFLARMFRSLAKTVLGKTTISYQNTEIALHKKFNVISFSDVLARYAFMHDFSKAPKNEVVLKAEQLGIDMHDADSLSKEKIGDEIFKKVCRPKLLQPTFVTDIPLAISPLAKAHPKKDYVADRYILIIGGLEIANGFSELNDPVLQRARFEQQEAARRQGDEEASRIDEEFLTAMEYGMPPAAGLGIGLDRLAMLFLDVATIREAIIFPTLRDKNS